MTRKEAYNYFTRMPPNKELLNKLIGKIYDDFESRTCGNCKYWAQEKEFPRYCELLDVDIDEYHKDFGCNKWEAKDD